MCTHHYTLDDNLRLDYSSSIRELIDSLAKGVSKMFYHIRNHVTSVHMYRSTELFGANVGQKLYVLPFRFRIVSHHLIIYLDHFCITSCFALLLYTSAHSRRLSSFGRVSDSAPILYL